jgi:hypothetical protein
MTKSSMLFNCLSGGDQDLPRWAPNWTVVAERDTDLALRSEQEDHFRASGSVPWYIREIHNDTLTVKGFRLDTLRADRVANVLPMPRFSHLGFEETLPNSLDAKHLHQFIWSCRDLLIEGLEILCGLPWHLDWKDIRIPLNQREKLGWGTIARIMLNDRMPSGAGGLEALDNYYFKLFLDWIKDSHDSISTQDFVEMSENLYFEEGSSICEFVRSAIRSRSFFTTPLGYLGLINKFDMEDREELWILAGGSHPVVLKPCEGRTGYYYPICEAYVQGIMQGEAVRGEYPVIPRDGAVDGVIEDVSKGRQKWDVPQFKTMHLV